MSAISTKWDGVPCSVSGCDRKVIAVALCERHYKSNKKYGDPAYVDSDAHKAETLAKYKARPPHWTGKVRGPFSEETKAKMSKASLGKPKTEAHAANIAAARTGTQHAPETIEKFREWAYKNALERPLSEKAFSRGIRETYRGIRFRSTWETRFAQACDAHGILWDYEKRAFDLGTCTYRPDFELPFGVFVEIKGWLDKRSVEKLALFRKLYPDITLVLVRRNLLKAFEHATNRAKAFECLLRSSAPAQAIPARMAT